MFIYNIDIVVHRRETTWNTDPPVEVDDHSKKTPCTQLTQEWIEFGTHLQRPCGNFTINPKSTFSLQKTSMPSMRWQSTTNISDASMSAVFMSTQ